MFQRFFILFLLCIFWVGPLHSINNKKAWIDFPGTPLPILLKSSTRFNRLIQIIEQYHKIDKQSIILLKKRIQALDQISKLLNVLVVTSTDEKERKELKSLALIASKKSWYLSKLNEIYINHLDQYKTMKSIYGEELTKKNKQLLVLPLVNKIIYDTRLPGYWGMYWLEALDPCHRLELTPHYIRWKKEKSSVPFFMWLETQDIQFRAIQVDVFDQSQLKQQTCYISQKDHLLHDSMHQLVNYNDETIEYIYIITLDKKIIIAPGNEKVRHLSLSGGRPVLAAGALKVSHGKIIYLDVESGHYQPTRLHMKQAIDLFQSLEIHIDSFVKIKFYEEGKVVHSTVQIFKKDKDKIRKGIATQENILPFFSLRTG